MNWKRIPLILSPLLLPALSASAQHLWWNLEGQTDATCLYGEIRVLATHQNIYYCGANWHPGEPAGGYCGIQHNGPQERRNIFSIWDTSAELHPKITAADPQTIHGRFGGEGEGGHTHMPWPWKTNEIFQFFVQKQPGVRPDTTDCRFYVYDPRKPGWRHVATICNPNGGHKSVATLGGGMNSFLENFAGTDRAVAKLATYRLWLGPSVEKLKCLTRARGDGRWGQLEDAYFLAEGGTNELNTLFSTLESTAGKPTFGARDKILPPLSDKPVPPDVIEALKNPPQAPAVEEKKS